MDMVKYNELVKSSISANEEASNLIKKRAELTNNPIIVEFLGVSAGIENKNLELQGLKSQMNKWLLENCNHKTWFLTHSDTEPSYEGRSYYYVQCICCCKKETLSGAQYRNSEKVFNKDKDHGALTFHRLNNKFLEFYNTNHETMNIDINSDVIHEYIREQMPKSV
ncbi:hypothetical protein D3C76_1391440 [compost metagenome]